MNELDINRIGGVFYWLCYWLVVVAVLVTFVWLTIFKPTPLTLVEPLLYSGAAKETK